ncbi:MAG: prolipoprotein diacylglyceryl transferase family protein [Polyangiales bacterium]
MHPILVHVPTPWGAVPVYGYGVFLGLALLAGWYLSLHLAERDDRDASLVGDGFLVAVLAGLVGGRLAYVLVHPGTVRSFREAFAIHGGGMVGLGSIGAGLLALLAFARYRGARPLVLADLYAPAFAAAAVLVRGGCYLFGCCFGRLLPEHAPRLLAKLGTFPRVEEGGSLVGSPAYLHHLATHPERMPLGARASLPVHPTQLYEIVLGLAVFGAVMVVHRRRRFDGQTLTVALFLHAVVRLAVEPFRGDPGRGAFHGVSTTVPLSTALALVALVAYVVLERTSPRRLSAEAPDAPPPLPPSPGGTPS